MFIRQISVFAENRSGSVMEITGALNDAGINIRAFSIADTSDFGVVRLIVDDTPRALEILRSKGVTAADTDVIAVSVADTPGAFHQALSALYEGGIMVEYAYAFVAPVGGGATVILRCREQERAAEILIDHGMHLLKQSDVSK